MRQNQIEDSSYQNKSVIIKPLNRNTYVFIFNDKDISLFPWYDVIMISREFSELSEEYRARVARVV